VALSSTAKPTLPFIVPGPVDDLGPGVYEFRAVAHIARRAGVNGLYFGSGTKSANTCRMSIRRWRTAIAQLVKRGLLVVVEENPRSAHHLPVYDVH
jgi:hypothetical protein